MSKAIFQRMSNTVLALMGEDCTLRGNVACRANIEHGVQVTGEDGLMVLERSVATIGFEHNPKVGDTLTHPDGAYRLDVQMRSNGFNKRFILIALP
jgi:hypothetical protein